VHCRREMRDGAHVNSSCFSLGGRETPLLSALRVLPSVAAVPYCDVD
jgi:hypothetical protein